MTENRRAIGPIGTASRAIVGLIALYLALADGPPLAEGLGWGLEWYDAALGLILLPAISVGVGLLARRYADGDVRLTGGAWTAINCAVIVILLANPYTAGGALLFYGPMMLVAAFRGQAGCEGTVLSNWILDRDDQIGCPVFSPIDAAEERFTRARTTGPVATRAESEQTR